MSMSRKSSDSENISVEIGDGADDLMRGGLCSTEDQELTGVLTMRDENSLVS